ncbi:unnamed protein product [Protopolystoma xenopodis]|uniref:Uncharacterized protein n=1 Tax=Protopolystoma xenopodis TaxID=117903 RepID=A0A448XPA1_9PLAT|nr:unnamed protein product [Protopolystoma xenopodis]
MSSLKHPKTDSCDVGKLWKLVVLSAPHSSAAAAAKKPTYPFNEVQVCPDPLSIWPECGRAAQRHELRTTGQRTSWSCRNIGELPWCPETGVSFALATNDVVLWSELHLFIPPVCRLVECDSDPISEGRFARFIRPFAPVPAALLRTVHGRIEDTFKRCASLNFGGRIGIIFLKNDTPSYRQPVLAKALVGLEGIRVSFITLRQTWDKVRKREHVDQAPHASDRPNRFTGLLAGGEKLIDYQPAYRFIWFSVTNHDMAINRLQTVRKDSCEFGSSCVGCCRL